ncbi:hypothetical protein D1BOALGB6SA_6574 [Olavius sp. associated proteobacterium Delta 1]|nr:hypothetical protein D1BOALGB6SA_6574 [Olavius sp. associated proteobacterium Delta 1]
MTKQQFNRDFTGCPISDGSVLQAMILTGLATSSESHFSSLNFHFKFKRRFL